MSDLLLSNENKDKLVDLYIEERRMQMKQTTRINELSNLRMALETMKAEDMDDNGLVCCVLRDVFPPST